MTEKEILAELRSLGTEQNRKIYSRHGVQGEMFGVSYANLEKLRKKIKTDHMLAGQLWAAGNHDARILATMIADPAALTDREIENWSRDLSNYVITDAVARLIARSPLARKKMERWTKSKSEWTGRAGWIILGVVAMKDDELPDEYFENHLEMIERGIHSAKNRVRAAMNGALIGIGMRNSRLEKKALAAAARIGRVEVDHGETGCKTPDAAAYIRKAAARKKR
ncbi:MAG TPA: DNA alkylation repair protein [Blastocatellia bacterium]|jgi:3-methyladenine DNA glycosylase AlkD